MSAPAPAGARRPGLTLRARLGLLLGVGGLVLAVVVGILLWSLAELRQRRDAVIEHYDPAALAVSDLEIAMLDQETGVRGFVLSADPTFLDPYFRGIDAAETAFTELDELLAGTPVAEEELEATRAAVDTWGADYVTGVVAGTVSGADPDLGAFLEDSRLAFEEVRIAVDSLSATIASERDAALEDWEDAFRGVVVVAFAAVAVLVVGGVVVTVALRRSVTGPVDELTTDVRAVAEGALDTPVRGVGPPELVQLGADIEAMRLRILEELRRLSEANAEIAEQAVELERSNADLEQFAYVASHDLQEPLRKIAGFCQLLERRYKGQLDERADQYIEFVVDGAKRMQDLINDLLAFSRVGRTTDRFVPVSLNAAVDAALANLGTTPEEQGATIVIGELPTVPGDPRLLTALFQNLVGNALKFRTETAPRVEIRPAPTGADDGEGTCAVTVSDNGIGIDPEYADQIFTLFQRLHNKSQYEGTGIGLALCKKIVEFHGGTIALDTEAPGPGTTFRFTLPLEHADTATPDEPTTAPAEAGAGAGTGARSEAPVPDTTTSDTTTPSEVPQP